MSRTAKIVFFGVVPVLAVAMVGATFATSSDRVPRALVVYGPRAWAAGRPVPLRLAVFGPEDQAEAVRVATIHAGGRGLSSISAAAACEAVEPTLVAPRRVGPLRVRFEARTARGTATAHAVVRIVDRQPAAPRVPREAVWPAFSGSVRIEALPAGGAIAASDPLPVYFRFTRRDGTPWSGTAAFAVRIGGLTEAASTSLAPSAAGIAEVVLHPLVGDLHVEVAAGGPPARMVLPVRGARPTVHVAAPSERTPVREIEVRSQSGARCAYVDLLAQGARRALLSAPLVRGIARMVLPDVSGIVAIQAATHFADPGEAVTVRHAWVGRWIDIALGQGEDPLAFQARLASMDAVRYPTEVLVDGADASTRALRARRSRVRTRAVVGIGLCAVAELAFLGRVGARARKKARALEDAAARETNEPAVHGSDFAEIAAFAAALAAAFAALAAIAGLLP